MDYVYYLLLAGISVEVLLEESWLLIGLTLILHKAFANYQLLIKYPNELLEIDCVQGPEVLREVVESHVKKLRADPFDES